MISGLAKFSGGLENVVNELSSFLVKQDVEVNIFGRSHQDFVESRHNYKTIGVGPTGFLPPKIGHPFLKFEYSLKAWRKTRGFGPYDIIHGHGDNCFFSSLFRDKSLFLMTFHGTMAKSTEHVADLRNRLLDCAEKVAVNRCDIAVACSEAVKNELVQYYGVTSKKIQVIHNGVNVEKFVSIDKKKARQKLCLPEHNTYALWVGGSPHRKGLVTAIKAVEESRCSKLLVAGMTGSNSGKTVFLGKTSEQDLIAAYSAADVLLLPTIYEGFPMVALEALSCGLPLIVSEASNMGEIIKEGDQGFVVKEGNHRAYRENIDNIINDTVVLKEMTAKCRQLALNYSWQKQAGKYWQLYQQLLRKH